MKKLIFILSLFITITSFSQTEKFNITLPIETNSVLSKLIELDSSYIVMGWTTNQNIKFLFAKINKFNQSYNYILYGDSSTGYYPSYDFVKKPNNDFIAVGAYVKNSIGKPIIIEIDSNLNILKDTMYLIDNKVSFDRIFFLNKKIIFGGNTRCDNNWDSLLQGNGDPAVNMWFWKTDSLYEINNNFNSIGHNTEVDALKCMAKGFNNNFLLGGGSLAFAYPNQTWYLVNVDTSGNVLGEYNYGNQTMTNSESLKAISSDNDSCYYLAGMYGKYIDTATSYYNYAPYIIKLDQNFNTLWEKDMGKTDPNCIVADITKTYNNCQLLLTQESPVNISSRLFSQVTKFNTNGNVLWQRNFLIEDTTNYIRYRAWDILETRDNGFAICGSAIDSIGLAGVQHAWFVKTDSLGCDDLNSCNDTALIINPFQIPDTLCLNDTNWVTLEINGRSAPYTLTLSNGQEFDSIFYSNTAPEQHIFYDMPIYPASIDSSWQVIVTLTDTWGANITDTLYFVVKDCTTLVANDYYVDNKIKIYPNPAKEILNVQIRGTLKDNIYISLYSSDGRLCKTLKANSNLNQIDVSNFPQGLYFIKVQGVGFVKTEKIIVE